jgi:AcrR family transcriptional regulator
MGATATATSAADLSAARRGRPPRTGRERAFHRRRLLEAAMEAVRLDGAGTSIDQIARAAGVSKPVLYAEFGDKLGIAEAVAVLLADQVEKAVVSELAHAGAFDVEGAIKAIVETLLSLVDSEPKLYGFLVRNMRMSERGLLDNALVRVIHQRASLIVGWAVSDVERDELAILTDGVFGFVFAAVESWMTTRRPSRKRIVATLAAVIRAGLVEAGLTAGTGGPDRAGVG